MNPDVIPVDFNNCDEDGAVRLDTRGTLEHLASHRITLSEGLPITVTDSELIASGRVTFREGMWVAVIERLSYLDTADA